MLLLDTNVVSEMRRIPLGTAHPAVSAWSASVTTASTYMSVITILEIETGILRVARRDPTQATILRHWFDSQIRPAYAPRTLPVTDAIAIRCAALHVPDRRPEHDALIAATALVHGLTLVTRNTEDFARTGARLLDPWQTPH